MVNVNIGCLDEICEVFVCMVNFVCCIGGIGWNDECVILVFMFCDVCILFLFCGDDICDDSEDISSCLEDCDLCGDSICQDGEIQENCFYDCIICLVIVYGCMLDCIDEVCVNVCSNGFEEIEIFWVDVVMGCVDDCISIEGVVDWVCVDMECDDVFFLCWSGNFFGLDDDCVGFDVCLFVCGDDVMLWCGRDCYNNVVMDLGLVYLQLI